MKRIACLAGLILLLVTSAGAYEKQQPAPVTTAEGVTVKLDDLRTRYGSCRVGRRGSKLYCVLTATKTEIRLTPNIWGNDAESKSWNDWLSGFDDDLYSKWLASDPGDGQETVQLRILPSGFEITKGTFLPPDSSPQLQQKFDSTIQQVVADTLRSETAMPKTTNPLKEVRLVLTFMSDASLVPRYAKRELGFVATIQPSGNKMVVYGKPNSDGLTPGIQIIGEGEGDINIVDADAFAARCAQLDAH